LKSRLLALHLLAFALLGAAGLHAQSPRVAATAAELPAAKNLPGSPASCSLASERNPERESVLDQREGSANPERKPSSAASLFVVAFLLLLLAAGLYAAILALRRSASRPAPEESPLRVLACATLGPGRAVHAVGCGSKVWLVASSEYSVGLVDTVEDPELIRELFRHADSLPPAQAGFSYPRRYGPSLERMLSSLGSGFRPKGKSAETPGGTGDYLAGQRKRLDKYRKGEER
jgi:hypothetical protein